MLLIDTHNHIHSDIYELDGAIELERAKARGVEQTIVVGEGYDDCLKALEFAATYDCYATVGVHPHDADKGVEQVEELKQLHGYTETKRTVAIGECGLDYYYMNSSKQAQKEILKAQFDLAELMNIPMVYHIRGSQENPNDAFSDFFEIYDANAPTQGGVVHSFSAHEAQLSQIIQRDLYVGLNGIMTFTKDQAQLDAAKAVPLDKLVLETDAPFLTPKPFRGKINSPQYVVEIAEFLSVLRGERLEDFSRTTYENSRLLFGI